MFLIRAHRVEIAVLNDQPPQVTPEEADQGAVRIRLLVGVLMMHPMDCNPASWRALQRANTKQREAVLEPFRALETAVGEQPVVTNVDTHRPEHIVAQEDEHQPGPGKQSGDQRQRQEQMESNDHDKVRPEEPSFAYRIRSLQADLQSRSSFLHFSVTINPSDRIVSEVSAFVPCGMRESSRSGNSWGPRCLDRSELDTISRIALDLRKS